MLKKTIALAAGLSLLTGCITSREFGNLSSTLQKGTLLARSMTVSNPKTGNTEVTNFLGWISLSGKSPKSLKRNNAPIATQNDLGGNAYQDKSSDLLPGLTYFYSLDFGDAVATQSIIPMLLPDTRLTSTYPVSLATEIPAGSKPTFTWTLDGALPMGYVITVAKMPDAQIGSSLSGGDPTYMAFLDAKKHSKEVTYGTPSDLEAITGDALLSSALANLDGGFFAPKDEPLTEGTYAWTIVPLDHDPAKTAFAIGKPDSIGMFTVK